MTESTPPIIYKIMYYFVYHINTIALYWREKPTLLVNEYKEIDNSPIEITQWVGAMAQDGKIRWVMITKIIMGVIFNVQNSHSSTLSLPTEEIFLVNGPNCPWQIFQSSIFALSRDKCCYFRFFIPFSESLNVTVCKWYGYFSVSRHDLRKFPQTTLDWEWRRFCRSFIWPDRVAQKASDVSAADWGYQIHVKKIWYFFHLFCYDISWSWKSNGEMLNKLEKYITVQRNLKLSNVWSRVWLNSSVSLGS